MNRTIAPGSTTMLLRIGVSARFFHHAPAESGLGERTLLYLEQSITNWLLGNDCLPMMVPSFGSVPVAAADRYARALDGLVLQGGVDLSPLTYGQKPLSGAWAGDGIRDAYELDLLRAFISHRKPVLGICRGAQLINVAFGGTLFQDIATQVPGTVPHRDLQLFDRLRHEVSIEPGTRLAQLYPSSLRMRTNSLHHQAVDRLGAGLTVEARAQDGMIEAVRWNGASYVFGVQWHPEWHPPHEAGLLRGEPILREFLDAARGQGAVPGGLRLSKTVSAPSVEPGNAHGEAAADVTPEHLVHIPR